MPGNIFFPNATSITFINCNNRGIENILYPKYFPNVNRINYLSYSYNNIIHKRFENRIEWVFPNKDFEYFNYMVEAGYGRKDDTILKTYITNKKNMCQNGFDITYDYDIIIPDYGIINSELLRLYFYKYLLYKKNIHKYRNTIYPGERLLDQDVEELELQKELVKSSIEQYQCDILDNDY